MIMAAIMDGGRGGGGGGGGGSTIRFILILFICCVWLLAVTESKTKKGKKDNHHHHPHEHGHQHASEIVSMIDRTPVRNEKKIQNMVKDLRHRFSQQAINHCYHDQYFQTKINVFQQTKIKMILQKFMVVHMKVIKLRSKEIPFRTKNLAHHLQRVLEWVKQCARRPPKRRYKRGLTSLSILTYREYKKRLSPKLAKQMRGKKQGGLGDESCMSTWMRLFWSAVPATWDWRQKNAVTPVKDQGQCGSCFIFGSMVTVEGSYLIKNNHSNSSWISFLKADPGNATFSEQAVLNCLGQKDICSTGGNPIDVFGFLRVKGVVSQQEVPYTSKQAACGKYHYLFTLSNYCTDTSVKDDDMKAAIVNNGPAVIGIDASSEAFQTTTDIFNGQCGTQPDHAVAIVGFDKKYWIIKNSWGPGWGKQGYFRLPFGNNKCGYRTFFGQGMA